MSFMTRKSTSDTVFLEQALPRLTNRERLVQMADPALKGQFAVKDLIQVSFPRAANDILLSDDATSLAAAT